MNAKAGASLICLITLLLYVNASSQKEYRYQAPVGRERTIKSSSPMMVSMSNMKRQGYMYQMQNSFPKGGLSKLYTLALIPKRESVTELNQNMPSGYSYKMMTKMPLDMKNSMGYSYMELKNSRLYTMPSGYTYSAPKMANSNTQLKQMKSLQGYTYSSPKMEQRLFQHPMKSEVQESVPNGYSYSQPSNNKEPTYMDMAMPKLSDNTEMRNGYSYTVANADPSSMATRQTSNSGYSYNAPITKLKYTVVNRSL